MPIQHLDLIKQAAQHILDESKLGNIDLSKSNTFTCHVLNDLCFRHSNIEVNVDDLADAFMKHKKVSTKYTAFIHTLLELDGVSYQERSTPKAQELFHKYRVEWLEFIINYQEV